MRRSTSRAVLAVLLLSLAASCAQARDDAAGSGEFFRYLRERSSGVGRLPAWYRNLGELLPNTKFAPRTGPARSATSLVVAGVVRDVTEGLGFVPVPEGAARRSSGDGIPTRFDDPRALWRTVHLGVEVERSLGGGESPDSVSVGLAIGPDMPISVIRSDLVGRRMVFFLKGGSPVFSYDSSLYAVVEDGALLVLVGVDGRLSIPGVEPEREEELLAGTRTLQELEEQARAPERTIPPHNGD